MTDEPVRIVPYDPSWPERFEEERAALADALGGWVVGGIHHVGSTSVPGLDAKPVIDILVGSSSEKIIRWGHDDLSTYGIGKELDKRGWRRIADELLRLGLIRQHPDRYNQSPSQDRAPSSPTDPPDKSQKPF